MESRPKGFHGAPVPGYHAPTGELPIAYAVELPTLPSALQLLESSTGFFIREKVNWFEEFTGWELGNKYKVYWRPEQYDITNPNEQDLRALANNHVFNAIEESDTCSRQCCGANRSFQMHVHDAHASRDILL